MHLFAGAGGGLLADLVLGHRPQCAVEIDPYCCRVLRERAADGWFPGLAVHEQDVREFDPAPYAGRVDCLAAGFPCTDISVAGSKGGVQEGTRSGLWSEVVRCARVIRPRFLWLENVPAIVSIRPGLDVVLSDLADMGLDAIWCCVRASDVGAPIERDRWWCLAAEPALLVGDERAWTEFQWSQEIRSGQSRTDAQDRSSDWLALARELHRSDGDVAARVYRVGALGNSQVPLQAALAWRILGGP